MKSRYVFISLLTILLMFFSGHLFGENRISVEMELYNAVSRFTDKWYYSGTGSAGAIFRSGGDEKIKAEIRLDFIPYDAKNTSDDSPSEDSASEDSIPDNPSPHPVSVKKAYIKARFGGVFVTLGKNRLTWGEGRVFNAGDLLFGSISPFIDPSRTEIRNETAWLTAVNVPLGRTGFMEGVIMPPTLDADTWASGELYKTSGGIRTYLRFSRFKIEGGYFYKGEEKTPGDITGHRPYLSLHGFLGIDWYFSTSWIYNEARSEECREGKTWMLSLGLFHMFRLGPDNNLTVRLETLCLPFQRWHAGDWNSFDAPYETYALLFYPEIILTLSGSIGITLSSVFSPVDFSCSLNLGATWNIYQNFTILLLSIFNIGEEEDLFAWERDNSNPGQGLEIIAGFRYVY